MLPVGTYVLHKTYGICLVEQIEKNKRVLGQREDFYVLRAKDTPQTTVFIPVNNEAALSSVLPILSKEEILDIINNIKNAVPEWQEDTKKRQEEFTSILSSCNRKDILSMIISIYLKKKQLEENSKKLRYGDENILRAAEKKINSEFSLVLGITPEEVPEFIKGRLK